MKGLLTLGEIYSIMRCLEKVWDGLIREALRTKPKTDLSLKNNDNC